MIGTRRSIIAARSGKRCISSFVALTPTGESGAGEVYRRRSGKVEAARQLAYRLYTLCERAGWAEDARAYNELITCWSGIEVRRREESHRDQRRCSEVEKAMTMKPWRELPSRIVTFWKGPSSSRSSPPTSPRFAHGKGTREYQDPIAFFDRTYITEGMRLLLTQVVQRLNGKGGEPVIQLQTAFGGGKTHTMLAVYHLATRRVRALRNSRASRAHRPCRVHGGAAGAGRRPRRHCPRTGPALEARQAHDQDPVGRTRLAARRQRGLCPHKRRRRERNFTRQGRPARLARSLCAVRRPHR